jgi:hypothetical protein
MALLSEIIYTVANMRKNWSRSDDDLPDAQIAFIINYYRAYLIEQKVKENKLVSSSVVQNLGKVPLVKADKHENCVIGDCVLRTELKVPSSLISNNDEMITYLGLVNGSKPFQRTTYSSNPWNKYATYTSKEPRWYRLNGYIYIVNPPNPLFKYVNIQGIFQDPTEADRFRKLDCPDNEESDCWKGYDYEYPISISMLNSLYALMRDNEFKFANILPKDTTNDTQDN